MTYKAYLNNIEARTGRSPEDFVSLARKKGFIKNGKVVSKHDEIVAWLKKDFGLGHGHANALVLYLKYPEVAKKKIEAGE